jgi:hypothetical protein
VNQDSLVLAGTPVLASAPLVPALLVPALVVRALVVLALAVALGRARSRATRDREGAHAEAAALRARLEEVERRLTIGNELAGDVPRQTPPADVARPEFVITHLGEEPATGGGVPTRVEPALFADLVLREGVVRVVSLAAGVRAALAPETRNRIRFEVRREVRRRARKQRRSDTRLARRELASRQRAALARDEDAA